MNQNLFWRGGWFLATLLFWALPVAGMAEPRESGQSSAHVAPVSIGIASYYCDRGRRTANGEAFRPEDHTAAHPTLPFGTILRVTNLKNGLVVYVKVNDRSAPHAGRIIDLSERAARDLKMFRDGLARVSLAVVSSAWEARESVHEH
jgi:rare lipoprotein A